MVEDLVVIGQVTRPHGVRGEIRVLPFTEAAESFKRYGKVFIRPRGREAEAADVTEVRCHKSYVLLKFKHLHSRTQAEDLIGADILVRKEWLPGLEADEYYWTDLMGLEAYDQEGLRVGRVANIFTTGSDDVLVLEGNGRELLLPFRSEVVIEVDLEAGRILVNRESGLLDL